MGTKIQGIKIFWKYCSKYSFLLIEFRIKIEFRIHVLIYIIQGELNLEEGDTFHDRPPLDIVIKKFRTAKITAYIAGVAFTILFVGIWPGSMLTVNVLDSQGFLAWTTLSRGWAYIAATFIIIVPLVQEVSLRCHYQNILISFSIINSLFNN